LFRSLLKKRRSTELLNRRFESHKRSQYFVRSHNDTLSIVVVCIDNPDCSPFAIQRGHPAQTPTGLAEIVRDAFPILLFGHQIHNAVALCVRIVQDCELKAEQLTDRQQKGNLSYLADVERFATFSCHALNHSSSKWVDSRSG
jgi:hypothetical protein